MLYIGEEIGAKSGSTTSLPVDIAVDPLEGTNLVATGSDGALATLAVAEKGGLAAGPDIYMDKLVVAAAAKDGLDITAPVKDNLQKIARALDRKVDDLVVVVLDRDRHKQLIADIRIAGARVRLISDGDVAAGISAVVAGTDAHVLLGIGGAPEGVLTAAAAKCMQGYMQGRFLVGKPQDAERLRASGITNPDAVMETDALAPGKQLLFVATGVTSGDLVHGVRFFGGGAVTETLIATYASGTIRRIRTTHAFERERVGRIRL